MTLLNMQQARDNLLDNTLYRHVHYAGRSLMTLGRLQAQYFNLLYHNRGYMIDNEWAYRIIWPHINPLEVRLSNRLPMLVDALQMKLPGLIHLVWGRGRYIPEGSGITIERRATPRKIFLYAKPASPGTPVAPPLKGNESTLPAQTKVVCLKLQGEDPAS